MLLVPGGDADVAYRPARAKRMGGHVLPPAFHVEADCPDEPLRKSLLGWNVPIAVHGRVVVRRPALADLFHQANVASFELVEHGSGVGCGCALFVKIEQRIVNVFLITKMFSLL